jgi:hypothetical protein
MTYKNVKLVAYELQETMRNNNIHGKNMPCELELSEYLQQRGAVIFDYTNPKDKNKQPPWFNFDDHTYNTTTYSTMESSRNYLNSDNFSDDSDHKFKRPVVIPIFISESKD